jgi:hypothetical protein
MAPPASSQPSRAWALFYPAAALAAAGMIAVSFGPTLVSPASTPAALTATPAGPVIGPAALAKAAADDSHVVYVARGPTGAPRGLRLAVKPGAPPDAAGVVLTLGPEAATALSSRPVRLTLAVRPIADTLAETLSVRLLSATGAGPWVSQSTAGSQSLTFVLPALDSVAAIAFKASSNRPDFNLGIEINSISIGAP